MTLAAGFCSLWIRSAAHASPHSVLSAVDHVWEDETMVECLSCLVRNVFLYPAERCYMSSNRGVRLLHV